MSFCASTHAPLTACCKFANNAWCMCFCTCESERYCMYTSAPAGRKATASSKTSTTRERCNLLNGTLDWNDGKPSGAPSSIHLCVKDETAAGSNRVGIARLHQNAPRGTSFLSDRE